MKELWWVKKCKKKWWINLEGTARWRRVGTERPPQLVGDVGHESRIALHRVLDRLLFRFRRFFWWLVWCFHDEAVETQKKINIYILTKQLFWAIQVHKVRFLRGGVPGGVRRVKGPGRSRWRRRRRWILGGGTRCKKRRPGQPTNIHSPALASKQPDTDTTRFGVSQSKQRHIFDFCKQLIFMFIILIIVSFRSVDYVTVVRWSTNRGGKFWFPIFLQ